MATDTRTPRLTSTTTSSRSRPAETRRRSTSAWVQPSDSRERVRRSTACLASASESGDPGVRSRASMRSSSSRSRAPISTTSRSAGRSCTHTTSTTPSVRAWVRSCTSSNQPVDHSAFRSRRSCAGVGTSPTATSSVARTAASSTRRSPRTSMATSGPSMGSGETASAEPTSHSHNIQPPRSRWVPRKPGLTVCGCVLPSRQSSPQVTARRRCRR